MEIVTGKRGFPHVSSYEMQTFQRGLVSDGDVLLDVGDKLDYTIVDNNTIRILSGAILMQGIYCIIPYGTYDEMYIDSIEPGKVRKDVIYAQYNRDLETGMEEVIMDVKKGTEVNTGETPVQPSFPSPVTPLWEGGSFAYVKLYEVTVTYNAISVAEILDRSRVLLTPLKDVGQSVGDPANLTTINKTNVVSAVNEVNGKANANAVNIVTMLDDVSGLQSAVFSERKVYTERFATNVTGNGRLMLMVSTWKKDTACVNVRFSNRVTGGFTDVVLMIKQNSYYTKCKQMYNDGIGISKIYRGANNLTFDFEIPTSTNNAYDVYVTAPVWVSGTYETQTTLSGTEMTIDSFDYNEMESTVGNLSNLSTTTHANIVAAINEVNGRIVDSDYVVTEYSVPYVSGSNTIFMVRSNDVAVVGDEEYLLTVEIIDASGNSVEMLFRTTDDSVLNEDVFIFNKPQDSSYEAIPISKVEDATSFFQGNNADLWITLGGTPDVTVRLTHHKSKTYTVVSSPAMPLGTGRELTLYVGNFAIWSKANYNGQTGENVVKTNSGVSLITDGIDGDIGLLNRGEGDSQFANVRIFTPEGDVRLNNNYVGKTSLSGIGDGTITGAIAFSNDDGEEVSGNPITVLDAIDANAVELSVDIEPVQDLHGYDHPWVGGAGKNKLPMTVADIKSANTSGTWSGNAYTVNGVTFTIQTDSDGNVTGIKANGTASGTADFVLAKDFSVTSGEYILNGTPSGGGSSAYRMYITASGDTTFDNGSGTSALTLGLVTRVACRIVSGYNAQNLMFYPMIRLSTETDSSFAPYSNICPISAVTESINIWDEEWEVGNIDDNGQNASSSTEMRSKNYVKVFPDTAYYYKQNSSHTTRWFRVFYYDKNKTFISKSEQQGSTERTTPSNCYYVRFAIYGTFEDNNISINYPSTDTQYHAYHEPQIEIQRVGVNQWDEEWEVGLLMDDGSVSSASSARRTTSFIPVKPETTYREVSPSTAYAGRIAYYDSNKSKISVDTNGVDSTTKTFTTPQNCYFVRISFGSSYGTTYNHDISVNYPSTDTQYNAYQGETYIIKTGQNVYGGTLDATTGKMVVTHGYVDLGDLTYTKATDSTSGNTIFYSNILDGKPSGSRTGLEGMCSAYNVVATDYRYINDGECSVGNAVSSTTKCGIVLRNDQYTSASDFKTAVTGQQLVYELATPQTINLTPTQIKMLKGTNTVSSNAQNINLTYLKDNAVGKAVSIVEKEIEPQIEEIHNEINTKLNTDSIAPVENGDAASTSYAIGSYITRNNNLYKVISAIASGATFTTSNIQRTTVMAEILSRL